MPRQYASAPPKTTVPGRESGLAVRMKRPGAPGAGGEVDEPCVPNITGLVWIDPVTLEETTDDVNLELKEMGLDIDAGGPGESVNYWFPKSNLNWEIRLKGTLCCDCTVEWTADWDGGDFFPPAFRGRWDWAILIPQGEVDSFDLPQEEGTMTITATVTCPSGVFEVGPLTATVAHEE